MTRVLIETHGCTLNQSDSDIIGAVLKSNGVEVEYGKYKSAMSDKYDYLVMNTCTVKKQTEQRITDRLQRFSGLGKRLIVAGCLASANPDIVRTAAPDASILSTSKISSINELISSDSRQELLGYSKVQKPALLRPVRSTIARIPISEGCLSACTFCETKFARGPISSFEEKTILKAISMCAASGSKEIELTSQDTGAYGADTKTDISELVSKASEIKGDFMMRIGMLNPEHLHKYIDNLIRVFNEPGSKLFRFLHLPVQSGSNSVLMDMKRRYTIEEYALLVKELRRRVSGISIATDVIVGYPAETEEAYAETRSMIADLKPTITNISKFSRRPHASASKLRQLHNDVIKRRSTELSRMVRLLQQQEYAKHVGSSLPVLVTERAGTTASGRDANYRPVGLISAAGINTGDVVEAKLLRSSYACLVAEATRTLPFDSMLSGSMMQLHLQKAVSQTQPAGSERT